MLKSQNTGARRRRVLFGCALAALGAAAIQSQELIYQEDFETDGEAANPQRYTTVGRDAFEVDRIRSEIGIQDQLGPIYWAHNNEVSYAGVPAPTAARRMAMAWNLAITEAEASPAMLELFDSSIKWLLNNKTAARVLVSPAGASLGVLGDRLLAAGHTILDDDPSVVEAQMGTIGDLIFHCPAAGSRGATAPIPMLVIAAADHDDVLTSSIGTPTAFEPGKGTIVASGHPAAGGKTGEFDVAIGSFSWELIGDFLPANPIIVANFAQSVPPTVSSLEHVEAMVAGTKQSTSATAQVDALDFNDVSEGNWPGGEALPGGASGVWGLRALGKLNVTAAGTYTVASGADDGVRVRIDVNKNGFDAGDSIITDAGPHGHTLAYGNVTFPATGTYDIEVIAYNSGGGGDVEVSVSIAAGGGQTGLDLSPENWELLGVAGAVSPVKAQGQFQITAYSPAGDTETVQRPLIMLLNGPADSPSGTVFGGGPFTGQSGQRFFGGAGMNKGVAGGLWATPDTGDRTLTLRPINVAGKNNVKLTIACAGTFLDFERSNLSRGSADYLEVAIDTDGTGPKDFERLIFFTPPTAALKYVDDATTRPNNPTRLGLAFKDVTYDIPAGATELVVEVRAISTWWNEIFAFDNIRITAGTVTQTPPNLGIARNGANVQITFDGVLESRTAVDNGTWTVVPGSGSVTIQANQLGGAQFYRARRP